MAERPRTFFPASMQALRTSSRLRRNAAIAAVTATAVAALSGTIFHAAPKLLVWNASASMPEGLYSVRSAVNVQRGDTVVAWPPHEAALLAAKRGYLPLGIPLVKRVAAIAGDRVCTNQVTILVNNRPAAVLERADAEGRPLPRWEGCRRLTDNEYLLMAESPRSFDGRYFGVSSGDDVFGSALLLWPR